MSKIAQTKPLHECSGTETGLTPGTPVLVRVCDLRGNGEPTWVPGEVVGGPHKLVYTESSYYLVRGPDGLIEWWSVRDVRPDPARADEKEVA